MTQKPRNTVHKQFRGTSEALSGSLQLHASESDAATELLAGVMRHIKTSFAVACCNMHIPQGASQNLVWLKLVESSC